MANKFRTLAAVLSVAAAFAAPNLMAENIKIAFIDPLTGAFAPLGENELHTFQFVAEIANREQWAGPGNTIQVDGFDGKGSPQESLTQLKRAIDQGYHFVTQGNGSAVAFALSDAITKNNERNPGKEVVFLNYAAIDPDLTNSKCSFWHFAFDANVAMKLEALTSYMAKIPTIKKVYLIGQDYSFGHQVSRFSKEDLKRKRPDIQIVGDDFHPIATVKDFAPYVAKIKASGADSIITGNWGADLALLVKAAKEAGVTAKFYTFYAATTGVPTAMGGSVAGQVKAVAYWTPNNETFSGKEVAAAFKKKYNDDFYVVAAHTVIQMLANAVKETKSADPVKLAFALEGMKVKALNGDVEMRKADHQLQQPLYIETWTKVDGKTVKYDQENTGYGWKADQKIDAFVAAQPTSCQMKRPAR